MTPITFALRPLLVSCLLLAAACKRESRCEHCGMKLSPASSWNAELVVGDAVKRYDTPHCALTERLVVRRPIRVQEFYGRKWRDGKDVRFVAGSDVLGPMGEDLVPVDPARAPKFVADHGGTAFTLDEIPPKLLK